MEEATVHLGRNRPAQFENKGGRLWHLEVVAAASALATTGGEGGGESGLGHEGAAGIPIEVKTRWRLTENRASHGG
jgi:hypothetical protein